MSEKEINNKEGSIVTGRSLDCYAWDLFFDPELLRNKKILNLGCGSSNLGEDLKKEKINCSLVDLDLNYDPYINISLKPIRTKIAHMISRAMFGKDNKREIIRKIMGTQDRNIIQANMNSLPFDDESFDIALAYWSTYQIPTEKKITVFKEMLRVASAIHISPVLKEDLYFFIDLLKNDFPNFDIVLCYPTSNQMLGEQKFQIKEDDDYQKIVNNEYGSPTLYEPEDSKVTYKKILGLNAAIIKNGFTLILKKRK